MQFVLFSRLSVTPRVISFACLFLTTARLFMPFPMFFAILFTNNYVPAFILLFAFAYLLSAVGFVETVPPMKRWEYYTVAPCLYRAASTNGKTRREKYVAKGKRSVEDHKDPTAIKIVQIADPHLGAVTSAKTLRTFCEEVVEKIKPDLILLTGDMLTTEAYRDAVEMIQDSLAPLKPHKDIVYAAYGVKTNKQINKRTHINTHINALYKKMLILLLFFFFWILFFL